MVLWDSGKSESKTIVWLWASSSVLVATRGEGRARQQSDKRGLSSCQEYNMSKCLKTVSSLVYMKIK